MLFFLAKNENIRIIRSEQPNYNREKVIKKSAGNCYSQFPDIIFPKNQKLPCREKPENFFDFWSIFKSQKQDEFLKL